MLPASFEVARFPSREKTDVDFEKFKKIQIRWLVLTESDVNISNAMARG